MCRLRDHLYFGVTESSGLKALSFYKIILPFALLIDYQDLRSGTTRGAQGHSQSFREGMVGGRCTGGKSVPISLRSPESCRQDLKSYHRAIFWADPRLVGPFFIRSSVLAPNEHRYPKLLDTEINAALRDLK